MALRLGLLAAGLAAGWIAGAAPAEQDAVLLESGVIVRGKIIQDDDGQGKLVIETTFGTSTIPRDRIEAISRADAPGRKEYAGRRAKVRPGDAKGWFELGEWAREQKLEIEARDAFAQALKADPNHAGTRIALGQAQLDGKWLAPAEVAKKVAEGYEVVDGKLVKVSKYTTRPEGRRILSAKSLSYAERQRLERERKQRETDVEKYREQMRKEYEGVPWPDAHRFSTEHFVVECNSTKEVAARYAAMMEAIYEALDRRFRFPRITRQKSAVFISRNHEDFMEKWRVPEGVGGFYSPLSKMLCAYHGTFGLTGTTFSVLAHEGTHQFQGLVLWNFNNTPMWLIEGIAVYFGDGATISREGKVETERIPRDRLQHIQAKMRDGNHTKLKELVKLKRGAFGGTHYADAWALVYFFANCDDNGKRIPPNDSRTTKGRKLLSAYWMIGNERQIEYKDFEDLAKIHSGSVEELEKKWIAFTRSLPMPSGGVVLDDVFLSQEFQFELTAPGPGWQFYEEDREGLIVGMEKERTSATVEVSFRNNDGDGEEKAKPEEYIEFLTKSFLPIHHTAIQSEPCEFCGVKGFKVTYEDGGSGGGSGSIGQGLTLKAFIQQSELEAERKRKVEGPPRKYVSYILVEGDGAFRVTASAAKEEFAAYEKELDKGTKGFELILRRRW
ncbi:MAG: DUF1570 domain-containing protein [Planctomycetes bacterium]|nr:DUF1570 domain-containing protein [Planctomycetota bacterium]